MSKGNEEGIESYDVAIQFKVIVRQGVTMRVFTESSWRDFSSYWLPALSREHLCIATSPVPYKQMASGQCEETVDERLFTAVPCNGNDVIAKLSKKDIMSLIQDRLYMLNLESINVIVPITDYQWVVSEMQERNDLKEVCHFLEKTYLHEINNQAKTA